MGFPYSSHFFNWDTLCLRQEKLDDNAHHHHPESEKDKQPKLQAAQHCQEDLSDEEGEEHVDRYVDALRCRPDFKWEDLARYQPTEWAP